MRMNEDEIILDAGDGKKIYVLRNLNGDGEGRRAVVLCHGLTGSPTQYMHMRARNHFLERGYDVYRIFFYGEPADARNLMECTLDIHAQDLNRLLAHLKPLYQDIFIAGHSYGGLTILYAQPDVTAISFWDPAFVPSWHKSLEPVPGMGFESTRWSGTYHVFGDRLYEDALTVTAQTSGARAARITPPSQVVLAEPNLGKNLGKDRVRLFEALTCDKELVRIAEADHSFTVKDTVEELLEATSAWFGKF